MPELERGLSLPHGRHGLYVSDMLVYVEFRALGTPNGFSRRAKPGLFSPENVCGREKKDRLHPDVVI